jgi:hypothetical protein
MIVGGAFAAGDMILRCSFAVNGMAKGSGPVQLCP